MFGRNRFAVFAIIFGFSLSLNAAVSYDSIYWAPPLDVQGTKIVNANGYIVQLKGFAVTESTATRTRTSSCGRFSTSLIATSTNNVTWAIWVPMAEQLIDTIRARNPVVKAIVAGTVNWFQQAPVNTMKINRDKVIYSWHSYGITGSALGSNFGNLMTWGVAPILASE